MSNFDEYLGDGDFAHSPPAPPALNLKIENGSGIGCSVNRTRCACNAANFSEMSNIDRHVANRTWQDPHHRTVRGVGLPPNEKGLPHVRNPFDTLRVRKNLSGTPAVPKMHDRNDACADHAWIKGLGHSLVRMSKVHVYPRYHRRHRSDEIGIGGVAQCRRECAEVGPPQLEKLTPAFRPNQPL